MKCEVGNIVLINKFVNVKCDYLYTGIKPDDIIMVVGSVTQEQYDKFVDVYESLFS